MRDLIGRTLGHYRIVEKVGEGGMGEVYRARDERLDRDVAIKVLPEDVASDAERLRRFEREAKAVAALSHSNILEIFDFGTEGDVTFSVTELLEGETLRERLQQEGGSLPWRRVQEIAAAIADGLGAAHGKSVVHRDIKPSNIFLCSDGRVKILDFGLAATSEVSDGEAETASIEAPLTREGTVVGTVGYMAPEQVRGQVADHRSDIFALGCVLYEVLSGKKAFPGKTTADMMSAILTKTPDSLAERSAASPAEISGLVERCLEKSPEQRFQSARDLAFALRSVRTPTAQAERAAKAPSDDRPSVAVLPFANLSPDPEQEFFCDGMAEEIINVLTRIPGLRVIARTSSFAVGRMEIDVREAGTRLDVDSVLEGSVRRVGQRVRITAQLVTTSDGSHLWSERFDRELTDILALEDEIAETIAERLRVGLKQEDRGQRRPAVNSEAHALFLEGRHYFARGTPDAMTRAKECFERAIELDPIFALTYDSLAELYWYLGFFGGLSPREAFSQGMRHALRAHELDDT